MDNYKPEKIQTPMIRGLRNGCIAIYDTIAGITIYTGFIPDERDVEALMDCDDSKIRHTRAAEYFDEAKGFLLAGLGDLIGSDNLREKGRKNLTTHLNEVQLEGALS